MGAEVTAQATRPVRVMRLAQVTRRALAMELARVTQGALPEDTLQAAGLEGTQGIVREAMRVGPETPPAIVAETRAVIAVATSVATAAETPAPTAAETSAPAVEARAELLAAPSL